MKRFRWVIGLLLLVLLFSNCYRREVGVEPEQRIYVFAPDTVWQQVGATLDSVFNRGIRTPQYEKYLQLKYIPNADDMDKYTLHRNLMFVATLDSKGPIADLLTRSLSSSGALESVKKGQNFLFKKENLWAENQLILMLTSVNADSLNRKIKRYKNQIFDLYFNRYLLQLKREMYRRLEQKKLEKELLKKYQWQVRVQHDYFIAWESPDTGFVFLRRTLPERWLYVRWLDSDNPSLITKAWVLNQRDSVGVWFYGGDKVNRQYVKTQEVNFLGRRALRVDGLWENDQKVAGGPFREYVFYDEPTSRIYILDEAVFDPRDVYGKLPYLLQLDVMAHTFKTLVDIQRGGGK